MVMIYDVPFNFYSLLSRQNNITNETVISKKRVAGAVKLETTTKQCPSFMVLLTSTTKKERGRIY